LAVELGQGGFAPTCRNADDTAQGYRAASVDQFVGVGGVTGYQGVWTRGCEP
jgi:hypothetical protein